MTLLKLEPGESVFRRFGCVMCPNVLARFAGTVVFTDRRIAFVDQYGQFVHSWPLSMVAGASTRRSLLQRTTFLELVDGRSVRFVADQGNVLPDLINAEMWRYNHKPTIAHPEPEPPV